MNMKHGEGNIIRREASGLKEAQGGVGRVGRDGPQPGAVARQRRGIEGTCHLDNIELFRFLMVLLVLFPTVAIRSRTGNVATSQRSDAQVATAVSVNKQGFST